MLPRYCWIFPPFSSKFNKIHCIRDDLLFIVYCSIRDDLLFIVYCLLFHFSYYIIEVDGFIITRWIKVFCATYHNCNFHLLYFFFTSYNQKLHYCKKKLREQSTLWLLQNWKVYPHPEWFQKTDLIDGMKWSLTNSARQKESLIVLNHIYHLPTQF